MTGRAVSSPPASRNHAGHRPRGPHGTPITGLISAAIIPDGANSIGALLACIDYRLGCPWTPYLLED